MVKHTYDSEKGRVTYSKNILSSIVILAAEEVEGVAYDNSAEPTKKNLKLRPSVKVEFCKDGIIVDVSVRVKQNYRVPDVAFNIQESIKRGVETMTEYKVLTVNVTVLDVEFEDEAVQTENLD